MTNSNDPESICSEISSLLSELEAVLPAGTTAGIKVPPGVIPSVDEILPKYHFVANHTIQRNIAYAVEFLSYTAWQLNRFGIYGPIHGYVIKVGIMVIYMIVEAMICDFIRRHGMKPAKKLSKNLKKLRYKLAVDESLCTRIDRLHERRANIHLSQITDLEATKYSLDDWSLANDTLDEVRCYFQHRSESA